MVSICWILPCWHEIKPIFSMDPMSLFLVALTFGLIYGADYGFKRFLGFGFPKYKYFFGGFIAGMMFFAVNWGGVELVP